MDAAGLTWSVVVPVKHLHRAKTRLALPADARPAVVLAMAADTVAAAVACPLVAAVLVVTDDADAARCLAALGAEPVPDVPDAGLNPALAHGVAEAARRRPWCGVATLSADLPALRPDELGAALVAAAAHRRALVADVEGGGTTLLTARSARWLCPAYGPGSAARHRALGHVDLSVAAPSLRRDVDTLDDLDAAVRLGLGPRTRAALDDARARLA